MKPILCLMLPLVLLGCTNGNRPSHHPALATPGEVSPAASPADPASRNHTLRVTLQAPDTAWRVRIEEVYRREDQVIVLAQLSRPQDRMGAQMIATISDEVTAAVPPLPVKVYILGKTWGWENEEPYRFIGTRAEVLEDLAQAERIYSRAEGD